MGPGESEAGATEGAYVGVRRVGESDLEALTDFLRATWDPGTTLESVTSGWQRSAEANQLSPGEPHPTYLFLLSGRAIGHVSTIPVRLEACGRVAPARWIKGLMVLPEHRNGPVGYSLLKEAVADPCNYLALVVDRPARRLFEAVGFRDLGVLSNQIRLLTPRLPARLDLEALDLGGPVGRMRFPLRLAQRTGIARLIGRAALGASRTVALLAGRPGRECVVRPLSRVPIEACDALWRDVRGELGASPQRDGVYLAQRYPSSDGDYSLAAGFAAGRLEGFLALRRPRADGNPRLRGIAVATISELVFSPGRKSVGLALLAHAEREARRLGADVLLCSASDPRLDRLLARRGFLKVPANVHCLARGDGAEELPARLSAWWLTRGDSFADQVF